METMNEPNEGLDSTIEEETSEEVKTDWEPIKPPQSALEGGLGKEELAENACKYLRDRTLVITIDVPNGNPIEFRSTIEGAAKNALLLSPENGTMTYMAQYVGDEKATEYAVSLYLPLDNPQAAEYLLKGEKLNQMFTSHRSGGSTISAHMSIRLETI